MKTGICALIAGLLMLSPAYAEEPQISAGKVLENLAGTDSISTITSAYLNGIVGGFGLVRGILLDGGYKQALYCQPDKIALTVQQEISILKGYVERNPKTKDWPVGLVMFLALQDAFPCKPKQR